MTPPDRDLAQLCRGLYAYPGDLPVSWDHLDYGDGDGVCWAVKVLGDTDVLVFRGSVTLQDWLRDLGAWATPWGHDLLGPVHPGFFLGMEQVYAEVLTFLVPGRDVVVAGHSLGAARATLLTGMMCARGRAPAARVVFGEPKPGFARLQDLLLPVPARSYRNGDAVAHDVVTDVPFSFPPEDYVHPTALSLVCEPPSEDDGQYGMFAWHGIRLYEAALRKT